MRSPSPIAFSPGSATCFFSPHIADSPLATYSRGCAINLDRGVTAAVAPAAAIQILLNGRAVSIEPVRTVLDAIAPEPVCITFETSLPLGCGFGVSAACCLTAAFALARRFDLGLTRMELGLLAHRAEVTHRTGFGDVNSQLCGGVVLRSCRRGPLDSVRLSAAPQELFYSVTGEIRTASVLSDPASLSAIAKAGDEAVRWLENERENPPLGAILDRAVIFSEGAGLLTSPLVRTAIADVRRAGGHAMMIMLGQSVLATQPAGAGTWTSCRIDGEGTRYLP
jgi:pantoate kinase